MSKSGQRVPDGPLQKKDTEKDNGAAKTGTAPTGHTQAALSLPKKA